MVTVTEEMIRRRAFEIWVEEGGESPESNWLRNKTELLAAATRSHLDAAAAELVNR